MKLKVIHDELPPLPLEKLAYKSVPMSHLALSLTPSYKGGLGERQWDGTIAARSKRKTGKKKQEYPVEEQDYNR